MNRSKNVTKVCYQINIIIEHHKKYVHKLIELSYYSDAINQEELELFNEVIPDDQIKDEHQNYLDNANKLREKHRDLKDTFENLERKTAQGRSRQEFIDPKVIHLWNTAIESNFTAKELAALKVKFTYNLHLIEKRKKKNSFYFRKNYFISSHAC